MRVRERATSPHRRKVLARGSASEQPNRHVSDIRRVMALEREWTVTLQSAGEFWCEAGVLVAVFGPLEKLLRRESLTLDWIAVAGGSAMLLFAVGTLLKIGAVKWTNQQAS
jgi:hypothetical protein